MRRIELSSKKQVQQKMLSEMIEKILFDEKELEVLKDLISDIRVGRTEPKQLKAAIIENRANILNKILNIFPYYSKQISYQQQIDDFAGRDLSLQIQNELKEKNELLKRVGEWMQDTRKKLEEKTDTYTLCYFSFSI